MMAMSSARTKRAATGYGPDATSDRIKGAITRHGHGGGGRADEHYLRNVEAGGSKPFTSTIRSPLLGAREPTVARSRWAEVEAALGHGRVRYIRRVAQALLAGDELSRGVGCLREEPLNDQALASWEAGSCLVDHEIERAELVFGDIFPCCGEARYDLVAVLWVSLAVRPAEPLQSVDERCHRS